MSHYHLIACSVFTREMEAIINETSQSVTLEYLPRGLHDWGGDHMRERIQERIDAAEEDAPEAILLGYGLCNLGIAGLVARKTPLVIPRAHDCIAVFMGSARRFREYFDQHPDTYYLTSGWIEQDQDGAGWEHAPSRQLLGTEELSYEALVEQYGEDNAEFLYEELVKKRPDRQIAYIEMGVEPDDRFEKEARQRADQRQWHFDKLEGSLRLLRNMVNGEWNEDEFLIVPPGYETRASYTNEIISAKPASAPEE